MATDVFPFSVWLSGTNQNSIPANDNSLRVEVITGPALSIMSAQPASPAEGDQHILGAAPTGAQWASFTEDDVVIFKGGTWLAFAPYDGWLKFNADDGDTYQFTVGSGWAVFAGGGGGGGAVASVNGQTGAVVLDGGDIGIADAGGYFTATDAEGALQELGASRAAISETIDDRVAALLVAGTNITLTYNDAGNSLTIAAAGGGAAGGINPQTGTTYTPVLADAGKTITMANAAANTLTVAPNSSVAFPVGTQMGVMMNGAGQTAIAAGAGVTISSIETLQLLKQGAVAVLEQTATDVWRFTGELRPATPNYRSKQRFDPSNGTAVGTVQGVAFTSSGTVSHPTQASTSLQTAIRRTRWTTAASAGSGGGIRETVATKFRGNAFGIGGFKAEIRFDQSTDVAGHQVFVGLANSVAALAGDPSALTNMIGLGYDAADAAGSNWNLMHNDGSGTATRDALSGGGGVNGLAACARDNASVLLLTIEAAANGSTVLVSLVNETSGVTILNRQAYSTDLPVNTSLLALHAQNRTGATTTAGQLEVASIDVGYQE